MRRRVFVCAVAGLTGGCLQGIGGGCAENDEIEIRAEETEISSIKWENIYPIKPEELPEEERDIINSSLNNGGYTECYPGSEPLQSLLDRIHEKQRLQRENAEEESQRYLGTVYLEDRGEKYKLFVRVQDGIISGLY